MFSNNSFQFLNTCTKRALSFFKFCRLLHYFFSFILFDSYEVMRMIHFNDLVNVELSLVDNH